MDKGARIKKLRQDSNMSQVDLAKRIGVSKQTLYKYENNIVTNIPWDKVELLADELHTIPQFIMGWVTADNGDNIADYYDSIVQQIIGIFSLSGYVNINVEYNYEPILVFLNEKGEVLSFYEGDLVHKYELLKTDGLPITFDNLCTNLSSDFGETEKEAIEKALKVYHQKQNLILMQNYSNIHPIAKRKFPLFDGIAAGKPRIIPDGIECYVDATVEIEADYVLKVHGDSMTGARIHDGDLVFIRQQPMVENGQIAAVRIGDEATLKRVYYYQEKALLLLKAENPAYQDLIYQDQELENVEILGLAVAFQSDVK